MCDCKPMIGTAYRIAANPEKRVRKQFTAKVGTVFEHARLPLHNKHG